MSRVDQENVTVTLVGNGITLALGTFDSFTGGAHKAEDTKHRPGNMGKRKSLGGPGDRDVFNIGRLYELARDHPQIPTIDNMVGIATVTAVRQKLNRDRSPAGNPITFTGTLIGFTYPDHDSDSADKAMFELEVSADESIS